jgi:phage FluMu gp28-like protein
MPEILNFTLPHNFSPRWYQSELLQDQRRFKVAVFHRRGGKTKTVLNQQICRTQLKYSKTLERWMSPNDSRLTKEEKERTNVYYYFLPTYKQAKEVIWATLVKEHVPMELVEKINESELAIYYKNGSIQRFAGCEDINKHRGINPIDVVFDEFSEEDKEIWTAIIQPVLRENHGTATFIFTPKGLNHSWEILQFAKQHPTQWFASVKTVDDTKGLSESEIEEARLATPEALFQQEYYCNFQDNAGAFFRNVKQCVYEADDYSNPKHFYNLGVDLARFNDWTVLTPFDLCSFKVKKQERFNQVDWNFQKLLIEAKARKYNNAQLKIDRTGVGQPIVEDLENIGLNIGEDGAIVFSAITRRALLDNLAILLEQSKIRIPNDPGLLEELMAFQYSLSDKGKIEVRSRKGLHDDRVFSLALAVYGIQGQIKNDYATDNEDDDEEEGDYDKSAII